MTLPSSLRGSVAAEAISEPTIASSAKKRGRLAMTSLVFLLFFLASYLLSPISSLYASLGRKAMVATANPFATRVALEVLQRGGNAVDAAVAAQWVLNVVEPQSSGIGGGGFFLYYEAATKRVYFFNGREKAPAGAFPQMFLDKHKKPYRFYPEAISGGLPVGVPGTLKLLYEVHGQFGSKQFSFRELFNPAIEIAEKGFPVSERLAFYLKQEERRLKKFEAARQIFFDKKHKPLKEGDILIQQDLAKTFRLIQKDGPDVFYEGKIAEAIVETVLHAPFHPGYMIKQDLMDYDIQRRDPVHGTYRDYDIFSAAPPSSGGITLIEMLNILEHYHIGAHGRNADGVHLFSEAQKLAFRDRNLTIGDPDFTKEVMEKLLAKDWAKIHAQQIQFGSAIPSLEAAVRPLKLENTHTSHISIADEFGNLVAYTTTIEYLFGSALVVPGYGFLLNNELTDFDLYPWNDKGEFVPNAPAGDKRPRSSMTPTFIFKKGEPILIVGSPGGSKIIGTVANVIVNVLDFENSLEDALAAPRLINRDGPIEMEPDLYHNRFLRRELERRGHPIVNAQVLGNVQAVYFDHAGGFIYGESDPRGEGEALGY